MMAVSDEVINVAESVTDDDTIQDVDEDMDDIGDGQLSDEEPTESKEKTLPPDVNPQAIFLEYLKSPMVQLIIGAGPEEQILTAHQAILTQSPYFANILHPSRASTVSSELKVHLTNESLDAVSCFLQYQYTGEYFPRCTEATPSGLETDPNVPVVDESGSQLLKHARVYTLAEKLGLPALKALAHSKIHLIDTTTDDEIAYARYIYAKTSPNDTAIRKPIAAYWAKESHVLRHDAEMEFKQLCLEFPQFGFDVLEILLDQKEKKRARERDHQDEAATTKLRGDLRGSKKLRTNG